MVISSCLRAFRDVYATTNPVMTISSGLDYGIRGIRFSILLLRIDRSFHHRLQQERRKQRQCVLDTRTDSSDLWPYLFQGWVIRNKPLHYSPIQAVIPQQMVICPYLFFCNARKKIQACIVVTVNYSTALVAVIGARLIASPALNGRKHYMSCLTNRNGLLSRLLYRPVPTCILSVCSVLRTPRPKQTVPTCGCEPFLSRSNLPMRYERSG